jgi:hypothetical protein
MRSAASADPIRIDSPWPLARLVLFGVFDGPKVEGLAAAVPTAESFVGRDRVALQ